jgi:hypothetical protein
LNSQSQLQTQLNTAQQQGVSGNPGVVSAQLALANAVHGVVTAQQGLQSAEEGVVSAEHSLTQAHQAVTQAAQGVTSAEYAQQQAHQAVADAQNTQQKASAALHTAQQTLTTDENAASRSLDIHTAAGQQNMQMLLQLADTISKVQPGAAGWKTLIDDTAGSFGMSTKQAQNYLQQLGLIPKDYQYSITGSAKIDWGAVDQKMSPQQWANSSVASVIGGAVGHATGGHISGPGGPRDDMIPAMLSNGEFVVNAASTARNRGLLESINARGYADGGIAIGDNIAGAVLASRYQGMATAVNLMHPGSMQSITDLAPNIVIPPAGGGGGAGGQISYAAGAGVAQWAGVINQALQLLGQPASWLGTVERRMNQESGGNPNVVNKWDSNWAKGTPSVGLMQVIGPTFASNAGQFRNTGPFSYGVSTDPLANTFAGLNYALHRYGSLSALNRPGGYASGGVVSNSSSNASTYNLHVHNAGNNSIDLGAQFKRMEIMSGL